MLVMDKKLYFNKNFIMALNNSERIGRSLEALRIGLSPFFRKCVQRTDEEWMAESWHSMDKPQYKETQILLKVT